MRAKATKRFYDLRDDVMREAGDEFECSKGRFDEIVGKLGKDALSPVSKAEPKGKAR